MHYKGLYQNMFTNMQRSVFRDMEYSGDSSQSTVTLLHSESIARFPIQFDTSYTCKS